MITTDKYKSCTDDEINKQVHEIAGDFESDKPLDYCGNAFHSYPLMLDEKIGITPVLRLDERTGEYYPTDMWRAEHFTFDYMGVEHEDKNPLRAAMIVFLTLER